MLLIPNTILFALIGGILPAVIWLWFWLKEDKAHPEPRKLILRAFLYGMLAVPVALALQLIINEVVLKGVDIEEFLVTAPKLAIYVIVIWATVEEFLKYQAARNAGLKKRANNEPMDVMVYLITAALGFAALENALFLISPLLDGDTVTTLITTNMRFVGATLLHVATSAVIGVFAAFTYFRLKFIKRAFLLFGFIFSVILHSVFNLLIIYFPDKIILTFSGVWVTIVVILILFEKIKKIHLNKI